MQIYLPIAEMPINVLLILAMSAAVGFISGMFGIGGGFLMTPLLIFLGIPPGVAVATVTGQIAASSMTGVLTNWQRRQLDPKLAAFLIGGGLVGTALGVLAFNAIRRAGQLDAVITISYLALFTVVGGMMLFESLKSLIMARSG
ncbi:MAG: sulfite exporter TauE/SafE family protein, partial [Bosea sp. (in: a-proteobacteria)]